MDSHTTPTSDPRADWPDSWWTLIDDRAVAERYGIAMRTLDEKRKANVIPKPVERSPVQGNRTLLGDVILDIKRRARAAANELEGK